MSGELQYKIMFQNKYNKTYIELMQIIYDTTVQI